MRAATRAGAPAPRLLLLLLAAGLVAVACSEGPERRIERVRILEDRPRGMELGYGNLDMATNGEALLARTLIDAGDTVVDVGAHEGRWSLYVLEQQPDVRLLAFEPSPETFAKLEANLAGTRAVAVAAAVSDRAGSMEFHVYPGASLLNGFYDRLPDFEGALTVEVPTVRIDAYCTERGIDAIDYLKIDTEGAELLVLRGARGLLERQAIRMVQFEYGGTYRDAGISLEEVFAYLAGFDYEVFRIVRSGLLRVDGWRDSLENYRFANYLAVPR